jgi:hypothetical protein
MFWTVFFAVIAALVVFHHWRPVLAVCLVLVAAGYLLNAYHAWQGGSSNGEAINTAPLVAPPDVESNGESTNVAPLAEVSGVGTEREAAHRAAQDCFERWIKDGSVKCPPWPSD